MGCVEVTQVNFGPAGPQWDAIVGDRTHPIPVANASQIPYPSGKHRVKTYVKGDVGAVAARLAPGNAEGDFHQIIGCDDSFTVQLSYPDQEQNGNYVMKNGSLIEFNWCAITSTWLQGAKNGI